MGNKVFCVFIENIQNEDMQAHIYHIYSNVFSAEKEVSRLRQKIADGYDLKNRDKEFFDLGLGYQNTQVYITAFELQD